MKAIASGTKGRHSHFPLDKLRREICDLKRMLDEGDIRRSEMSSRRRQLDKVGSGGPDRMSLDGRIDEIEVECMNFTLKLNDNETPTSTIAANNHAKLWLSQILPKPCDETAAEEDSDETEPLRKRLRSHRIVESKAFKEAKR